MSSEFSRHAGGIGDLEVVAEGSTCLAWAPRRQGYTKTLCALFFEGNLVTGSTIPVWGEALETRIVNLDGAGQTIEALFWTLRYARLNDQDQYILDHLANREVQAYLDEFKQLWEDEKAVPRNTKGFTEAAAKETAQNIMLTYCKDRRLECLKKITNDPGIGQSYD